MLKASTNKMDAVVDSDDTISSEKENSDDEDVSSQRVYEEVQMIMSDRDFIYYITKREGMCEIMEGLPRDPYL